MTAAQRVDGGGSNDLWHYAVGSERKGPVPRTTIAKLLASGEISAETYVWQPGMDNWVHLGDAPTLKPLVAGLEGDGNPEEFVEEDTAFTSPADIKAVHSALDSAEDEEELSGDTIVEAIPMEQAAVAAAAAVAVTGPTGTQRAPKKEKVLVPAPARAAEPVASEAKKPTPTAVMAAAAPVAASAPAASASPAVDSGLLGGVASSTTGASSASGSDIFAVGGAAGAGEQDIFAGSAPAAEGEDIAGVHGRRQSSVLFSLDELGREEGKKGGRAGSEQFVTDTSGLIDIKAIATNEKRSGGDDPFGASAPNLVLAPRSGPAAMTIPIVERKRGNGPWILAAAALLLVGGVAVALIISSGKDPDPTSSPPALVAAHEGTAPAGDDKAGAQAADKADEAKAEAAKKAEADKVAAADDKAKIDDKAEAAVKPSEEIAKADGAAAAAEPSPGVVDTAKADGAAPAAAELEVEAAKTEALVAKAEDKPKVETKPKTEVRKPADRPKVEAKKPEERERDKPREVVVTPAPATNPGNTAKVNDLLNKLNSGEKTETKAGGGGDSSLPDKLSAATVRNTIKGRFGRCGGMISNATGSVTVQTQFVISSSGVVQSARVSDGGGTSPDVQRCVVSVIKETTFGKFKEPTMQVNLPVRLL